MGLYRETVPPQQDDDESKQDESSSSGEQVQYELRCSECGDVAQMEQLAAIDQKAREAVNEAVDVYSGDDKPQRKRDLLEQTIKELEAVLHPGHELLFNLYLPLINLCGALGDHRARLEHCRKVITLAEAAWPACFLPLVNYQQCLAVTIKTILENNRGHPLPKKLQDRYLEERTHALKRLHDILRNCRGENDKLAKRAQLEWEQAVQNA